MQGMPVICLPTGTRYVIQFDFHWRYDILTSNLDCRFLNTIYFITASWKMLPIISPSERKGKRKERKKEKALLRKQNCQKTTGERTCRHAGELLSKTLGIWLYGVSGGWWMSDSHVCSTPHIYTTMLLQPTHKRRSHYQVTVTSTTNNTQNIKSNCAKFTCYWLVLLLYKSRTNKALKAQDKQSKIQCELRYKIHRWQPAYEDPKFISKLSKNHPASGRKTPHN